MRCARRISTLGAHGRMFDACYTLSPVCMPARVSLATGLYPHSSTCRGARFRMSVPDLTQTVAELATIRDDDWTCPAAPRRVPRPRGDLGEVLATSATDTVSPNVPRL